MTHAPGTSAPLQSVAVICPATPSSSTSLPQRGRKRKAASALESPLDWEPLTPRHHCWMEDVMRRARTAACTLEPPVDWEPLPPRSYCSMEEVMRRARTAACTLGPPVDWEPLPPRKYCSMGDVMSRRAPPVDAPPTVARPQVHNNYQNVQCEACGSGDNEADLILCDGCDRGHHTFCLRPIAPQVPNGLWFCPICAPPAKKPKRFPLNKTMIFNFFGVQKDEQDAQAAECRLSQDAGRRRKPSLVMHKKRRRILPFVPSEDGARRLIQMASLATALTSSGTKFSDELTYMPNMAPRSSNLARLEKDGIQVMHREDKENIELRKSMQQRGECPPLIVVFDSQEGFTVQADGDIKDMTFLAEFAGDVDYLVDRENSDFNGIMDLLVTAVRSERLVICPDKRGNISRFISGINNHTQNCKKKQNVKFVRYDIDSESRVLLVACRDISCGQKLYCDYNGYEQAYPTHHFL